MIFDTHMHSEFSFDSKMKVKEILEMQTKKNIGISLTEHVDLDLLDLPLIDMDEYLSFYKKYKSDNFLVGIELGMSKINSQKTVEFAEKNKSNLDILVGSIHTLYGRDLFYLMKDIDLPKSIVYKDYLENMLFCIEHFDFFDTLAHIDYICRYANYSDKELYLSEYQDLLDKIFITLINKNKCLELNTRRLDDEIAFNSIKAIFKRYKELGGQYITLASDSHSKAAIAINFDRAIVIIKELNLTPVYFKNRVMTIIEEV
ncbi:MAG: PHP domain-containing protein [Sarcina sp.]